MNLAAAAPVWLIGLFYILLLAAVVQDVWKYRISNLICLAVAASAIAAMGFAGPHIGLWQNGAASVAVLGLGTLLFARGMIGGGDIKLLAAAALWFDLKTMAVVLLPAVFIAGGLLGAAVLLIRRFHTQKTANGIMKKALLPYGVAIAVGSALAVQLALRASADMKPDPMSFENLPQTTNGG
jgi:prepilin peptidase CpaA